jgi:acetyl esterase/lipase
MKKLHFRTVRLLTSAALFLGATMTNTVSAAAPNVATDPSLDPRVREFLVHINKDPTPFWELPQPKPQEILTSLQKQTPVDVSGVTTTERTIAQDGTSVKIYIMKPEHLSDKAGILFFVHGGVWIVGNFENHERLLRDLVVSSGQVGVFVEYTSLPAAKYPTQLSAPNSPAWAAVQVNAA